MCVFVCVVSNGYGITRSKCDVVNEYSGATRNGCACCGTHEHGQGDAQLQESKDTYEAAGDDGINHGDEDVNNDDDEDTDDDKGN
jgi:hypothetical protein